LDAPPDGLSGLRDPNRVTEIASCCQAAPASVRLSRQTSRQRDRPGLAQADRPRATGRRGEVLAADKLQPMRISVDLVSLRLCNIPLIAGTKFVDPPTYESPSNYLI
jgi:hypothetical protein